MNQILRTLQLGLLALIFTLAAGEARASHAAGMELTYTCTGGNTYAFTVRFYRDGCGITPSTSINMQLNSSCGSQTLTMTSSAPTAVNALCTNLTSQTCCGGGTLSCFTEYIYTGTTTLAPCADWVASYAESSRNNSILNLVNPGGSDLYSQATLNNVAFPCNNSVDFNRVPVVFACLNQPFTYNPTAFDPDGDSLVFTSVQPLSAAGTTIGWAGGYSQTNPLPGSNFSMNPQTGIITATPTASGNYVISMQVREYRNGVLVATTIRDIQVLVLANCTAQTLPPNPSENNVNGGTIEASGTGQTFKVCAGNVLTFNLNFSSTVNISYTSNLSTVAPALTGATLNMTGNNTPSINGTFSWNTTGQSPGSYTFYVTVQDQACPVPNVLSRIYTVELSELDASSSQYTICLNNVNTLQLAANGLGGAAAPGTYTWSPTTGLSNPNIFNPIATVSQPATYSVTYQNGVCQQVDQVVISGSPYSIQFPTQTDQILCAGGSTTLNTGLAVANPFITFTNNTATVIPRAVNGVATTTSIPFNVTGVYPTTISNAAELALVGSMFFNIQQQLVDHLVITLISPSGQQVILSQNNGGAGNGYVNSTFTYPPPGTALPISNYNNVPIPATRQFIPQGGAASWSNLIGSTVNGTWVLQIQHNGTGTTYNGNFQNATLTFNNINTPTFTWSPSAGLSSTTVASPSASPTVTTTYQAIAQNLFGCRDTAQITVFVQNALTAPDVICNGSTLNSVTFEWQPIAGAATYNISTNNGTTFTSTGTNTSYTATGLSVGQSVTLCVVAVPAANSACGNSPMGCQTCTAGACPAITPTITGDLSICAGSTTPLTAAAAGGTAPYTFDWSTNFTGATATVSPGIVTVTATDANGCSGTATVTVTTTSPVVTITPSALTVCQGGSAVLTATAGFTTYVWAPGGSTNSSIGVNASGNYSVTVSDANGCTGSTSFNFVVTPNPTPTISGSTTICNGASTVLDAGTFASYQWGGGSTATTQTINVGTPGTFNVTVTDVNGCTGTTTATVILASNLSPTISPSGPTTFCQGGSVILDAGLFGAYSWAPAANTRTVTVTTSGTYVVTVSNANGCTGTDQITVTVNPNPTADLGLDFAICAGLSPTLTVTPGAGTAPYTYNWTNNLSTTTALTVTPTATTTYNVTVTDVNNCTATDAIAVTVNPLPVATASNNSPLCYGATLQLNSSGAGAGGSYSWNNPASTYTSTTQNPNIPNADNGYTGTYFVTATTAAGCTATASTTVSVDQLLTVDLGSDLSICTNSNATLTPTVFGGDGNFTYAWSNGQTTATINVTPAATTTYTLSVTDGFGCVVTDQIVVNVSTQLLVNIVTGGPTSFCEGGTLSLDAGVFDNYNWSTTESTRNIIVDATGTYSVTVSDAQGCTGTGTIAVTENLNPVIAINPVTPQCYGVPVTLTTTLTSATGVNFYNWNITPAQTTANVTLAAPPVGLSQYNVTVTDGNGCTGTATTDVTTYQNPNINLPTDTLSCLNSTINITAQGVDGAAPYTYLWGANTNSATTATIPVTVLAPATYNLTLTDAHGCTATDNILVDTFSTIQFTITAVPGTTFCNGSSITLDAGSGFFSYSWSTGANTRVITVDQSGTYRVSVTDASVCQGISQIIVNELQPIAVTGTVSNVSCNGGNNGAITIPNTGITGGTNVYTNFAWSSGATTRNVTGLVAGTYIVTVTDNLGCTGTASFTVTQPATAVSSLIISSNATCFGTANGTAIVNPSGGQAPYTFLWSNNLGTSASVLTLAANQPYTVTVTDSQGCTFANSVTVQQPSQVVMTFTNIVPTHCFNSADGRATVVPSGGTPGYTYQWSSGATASTAQNLQGGNANVTVSDANGCTSSQNIFIPSPTAVEISVASIVAPDCNGNATGSATVSVSGGTPPYAYHWSVAAGNQLTATATGLSTGTFGVTVTDVQGCTAVRNVVVPNTPFISPNTSVLSTIACNGDSTGSISVSLQGGTPPYVYNWSNGATTATATALPAGLYTVTVTDAHGCTLALSRALTEPTAVVATATAIDATCWNSNDGAIAVSATGGTLPYHYNLNGGSYQNGSNFGGLSGGTFVAVVRDHNNCTGSVSAVITTPAPIVASIFPADSTIEYGDSLQIIVTSNVPVQYSWSSDTTLSCIGCANPYAMPHITTTYAVQLFDANGCDTTLYSKVNVVFNRRVYVANLFTPNGDGNNDIFMVQGGRGVKSVKTFRVFDRWGELVYQQQNVLPNTPGWDGTFKSKAANAGVFAWYAEILYDDGLVELIKGDVTLIR